MKITKEKLDELTQQAKKNPRLRVNFDLRNDANDTSQRMLNALEPGTIIPIHRHLSSSETMIVLRGRVKELFYDDQGIVTDNFEIAPNTACSLIQIPKGQFHSLECMESGTIIFEAKDGAYTPTTAENILSSQK